MKIISPKQMAYIESVAYQEGASEEDFMEEAGSGVALLVYDYIELHNLARNVVLLCGQGNNAGDAYVAGVNLLNLECQVTALQLYPIRSCSRLCQEHYHRFLDEGGKVIEVDSPNDIIFPANGIIVDGIFGTGFHDSVDDALSLIIEKANGSKLPIIAIDIPSGLPGGSGKVSGSAIIADETAFLGLPKTGFFVNEGWNHVGKLRYVDFGLQQKYIDNVATDFLMLTSDEVRQFLPKIKRTRHKYEAGYVVGLTGSPGMPGAALLSADAALHSGAGIVRILFPKGMEVEFGGSNPEILRFPYDRLDLAGISAEMNKAAAIYIGPGIGKKIETFECLSKLIPLLQKPCVLDADALTWISENDEAVLPEQVILTPHRGEMDRLLKAEKGLPLDRDYLDRCTSYAEKKRCTLILKGGPSYIIHPGAPIWVSPRGDPGMATAGSGDLLTGLLAGLLAQGLSPQQAAYLGVYIHGVAGEYAASEMTSYCMTANDILYHFPEGFLLYEPT